MDSYNRRSILKGLGIGGIAGLTPLVSASKATNRYIVDTGDEVSKIDRSRADNSDLEVIHDLENVGFLVVRGTEEEVEKISQDYGPDVKLDRRFDIEVPSADEFSTVSPESTATESTAPMADLLDVSGIVEGFPETYVWDAASMDLPTAHGLTEGLKPNGQPVRIGIIDDGVYDHPDLNVDVAASVDLTGDSKDVLHPNEQHYHGTHVAGIAAANGASGASTTGGMSLQSGSPDSSTSEVSSDSEFPPRRPEEKDVDAIETGPDAHLLEITDLTDSAVDPETLANAIVGDTVDIVPGSVQYTGADVAAGAFSGGTQEVGIDTGIILSSGDVNTVVGPNESDSTSTSNGNPGDSDLTNLSGSSTNDAAILEFEFTVSDDSDNVFLNYVFGSEEYNEFVGSDFNDSFGFFVNGSNAALVPDPAGGTQPASINNINNNENSDLYIDNELPDDHLHIEMDGLTVPIDLEATIDPAGTNTMKIGIADGADSIYDSWVFLAGGSFDTEPTPLGASRRGVAPAAEIVSMRYFSSGDTSNFFGDFAAAVEAAINSNCDVINASLGFINDLPESRTYLVDYIQNYIEVLANTTDEFGIVWVASAGNSGNNANDSVPGAAKAEDVLSVSSTGPTGVVEETLIKPLTTPAYYTTHGEDYIDVSAPGGSWDLYGSISTNETELRQFLMPDGVLSTFPPDTVTASLSSDDPLPGYVMPDPNGNIPYGFLQGTSMSAPQVTGVAALLKAKNPDWSAHEIRRVIKATARNVGKETYHGHGFVDPVAALQVDDPADVRSQLGNPDSDRRDDRGRNEASGGSPRDGSGGSSGDRDRGRGDDEDDEDDDDEEDEGRD